MALTIEPKPKRRKAARPPLAMPAVPLADVVQGLFKATPQSIDLEALRAMTGDARVRTHAEVAAVFGVVPHTVAQNWSPAGLPGVEGNYPIAEICAWKIERDRRNASRSGKPDDPMDAELRRIELRVAELGLQRKEREEAEAQGRVVDSETIKVAWKTLIATATEQLTQVPHNIEPQLPRHCAADIIAEITREIRHQLKTLSESLARSAGVHPESEEQSATTD